MSELTVLMAAVLIGGTLVLSTINEGVANLTENMFSMASGQTTNDFSAKFVKAP